MSPDAPRSRFRRARGAGSALGAWRFAPPLAAFALLVAVATFQADSAAAPETAFLAVWSLALLLPAAALSPGRPREVTLAPVLVVLAVWALPAEAARSAVLGVLLVTVLAVAGAGAWLGWERMTETERGSSLLAAALGAQVLLQGERLLAPEGTADLLALVVLPAVGGLALSRLARHRGLGAALVAAAAVLVLAPGWTLSSTLALVAVAVGVELAAKPRSLWIPVVGGLALSAGLAIETRLTAVALLAGVVVACDRRGSTGGRAGDAGRLAPAAALAVTVLAAAAAWWASVRSPAAAAATLAWAPVLLPSLLWIFLPRPGGDGGSADWLRRAQLGAAAGMLALASALGAPGPTALAAPLAALAFLLADLPAWASWPQRLWSAAVLAATAVFASYPWLRRVPAEDALGAWGVGFSGGAPSWEAAVLVVAAAALLGLASRRWRLAAVGLAVGLLILIPGEPEGVRVVSSDQPRVLTAERPSLEIELDAAGGPAPSEIALVTHLSNGASLAAGEVVATVRRVAFREAVTESWPLRAGLETEEWAVRRPDVAAHTRGALPEHWITWVEPPQPDHGPFFGQKYRAELAIGDRLPTSRLVIERADGLPAEVAITVHRVEVAP